MLWVSLALPAQWAWIKCLETFLCITRTSKLVDISCTLQAHGRHQYLVQLSLFWAMALFFSFSKPRLAILHIPNILKYLNRLETTSFLLILNHTCTYVHVYEVQVYMFQFKFCSIQEFWLSYLLVLAKSHYFACWQWTFCKGKLLFMLAFLIVYISIYTYLELLSHFKIIMSN